jgi:hypothetical protein
MSSSDRIFSTSSTKLVHGSGVTHVQACGKHFGSRSVAKRIRSFSEGALAAGTHRHDASFGRKRFGGGAADSLAGGRNNRYSIL